MEKEEKLFKTLIRLPTEIATSSYEITSNLVFMKIPKQFAQRPSLIFVWLFLLIVRWKRRISTISHIVPDWV